MKNIYDNQKTLTIEASWFCEKEDWKKVLQDIKGFKVLKMPNVIMSLFFMNKFERDQICEPNTQKLSWKKAKELFDTELAERMKEYRVWGEKHEEYRAYQRINFAERTLGQLTQEDVDLYH